MHWSNDDKNTDEILFGLQAIADFIGCSIRTLDRMRRNHDMPIVRLDFHRTFTTKQALLAFFAGGSAAQAAQRVDLSSRTIIGGVIHEMAGQINQARLAQNGRIAGRDAR